VSVRRWLVVALVGFVNVSFVPRAYAGKDVIVHDNTVDVKVYRSGRVVPKIDHGRTVSKANFKTNRFHFELEVPDPAVSCPAAPNTFMVVEVRVGPKGGRESTGALTLLNRGFLFWRKLRLEQPLGWTLRQIDHSAASPAQKPSGAAAGAATGTRPPVDVPIEEAFRLHDDRESQDLEIREVVVGYTEPGGAFRTWRCSKPQGSRAKFKMTFSTDHDIRHLRHVTELPDNLPAKVPPKAAR
jgi:hypothetical protein